MLKTKMKQVGVGLRGDKTQRNGSRLVTGVMEEKWSDVPSGGDGKS